MTPEISSCSLADNACCMFVIDCLLPKLSIGVRKFYSDPSLRRSCRSKQTSFAYSGISEKSVLHNSARSSLDISRSLNSSTETGLYMVKCFNCLCGTHDFPYAVKRVQWCASYFKAPKLLLLLLLLLLLSLVLVVADLLFCL